MSPKLRLFSRAVVGLGFGLGSWSYGYYWGRRIFVNLLGYDPIFETASVKLVSCFTGGVVSSVVCGLILWNRKLFPLLAAIMAAAVIYFKYNLQSSYWVQIDYIVIGLGYAVVPLAVVLFGLRATENAEKTEL